MCDIFEETDFCLLIVYLAGHLANGKDDTRIWDLQMLVFCDLGSGLALLRNKAIETLCALPSQKQMHTMHTILLFFF